MALLGIDARSDGVVALAVDDDGAVLASGRAAFGRHRPGPGLVEHAPEEVWRATLAATRAVLSGLDPARLPGSARLRGLGLSDAADVLVLWDRETLGAPRPALAGADRRAGSAQLGDRLAWLAEHEPRTWALVESGEYAVGGLASYLVARLTRGTWHVSDVGQAARTGLLDLDSGDWSREACARVGLPTAELPELVATWGVVDRTDARSFCELELPIAGLAVAGSATLLAGGRVAPGDAAYTPDDRTLLVLADPGAPAPPGLRPTLAWRAPDGRLAHALTATGPPDRVADLLAALPGAVLRDAGPGPAEHPGGADRAALGAAYLAGLGTGVWPAPDELPRPR